MSIELSERESQSAGSSSSGSGTGVVGIAEEEIEWTIVLPPDVVVDGDTDRVEASDDDVDLEIEIIDEDDGGSQMRVAEQLVQQLVDVLYTTDSTIDLDDSLHASVVRDSGRDPSFSSLRRWPMRNDAMTFTTDGAELSLLPVVTCFVLMLVFLGLTQTTRRSRRGWYSLNHSDSEIAVNNRQVVLQAGRHDDVDELYRWADGLDMMEEARHSI
ncbi:hypothetical protein P43SY_008760 [Pythium insidiosum]|uniref:Transmembrane protein n=1 Tax=Pythium insidiosum TaxID=114742 RepID=A0AAD5LXW4_PYTIN|nr:hypothetical protein P43SY_008760 [Pythium insidiosum]